jgi:prolyl-tRNA synthetase
MGSNLKQAFYDLVRTSPMRLSQSIAKTSKETSQSDVSRNAQLLTRGGFINQLMAGVYSFLPLGLRTLNRIEQIIREEMDALGAQEVLMPALHPRDIWDQTGRWDTVDVLFRFKGAGDRDLALGPTHEEVVTPLVTSFVRSYRDLPRAAYQIQTKFRNEARAKSGLLRGREFRMKDMYSFHATPEDLDHFYDKALAAYKRVYERCGLGAITLVTYASGGIFSKYSHEFQTLTDYGEDIVYRLPDSDIAINKEIIEDQDALRSIMPNYQAGDEKRLIEAKAIEVGNIFKLSTRFPDAFGATYTDAAGTAQKIHMGCFGIGPSRLLGTIAECLSDERGLIWPESVAPYRVHLVSLARSDDEISACDGIYQTLTARGIETLYDDRHGLQAGEKLADADLIGIPHRLVVSKKTLAAQSVEWKRRTAAEGQLISLDDFMNMLLKAT